MAQLLLFKEMGRVHILGGLVSSKGIFTSLSGAMAQNQRLETIANNIANSNSTAFKKDQQVFNEYMTANQRPPDVIQVPRVPASIESFYDNQGGDKAYVDAKGSFTDQSQGALKNTGQSLDVALEGNGYLEVLTPNGVKLTRNGALKLDPQGRLVTRDGHPVLREGLGQDGEARIMQIPQARSLTISYSGEIYSGDEPVGKLSLVNVPNQDALKKQGASLYTIDEQRAGELQLADGVKVHQGFLELSNVNIVEEMTNMISATRAFESNQQAIKAFDQMNGKLVNDVPR